MDIILRALLETFTEEVEIKRVWELAMLALPPGSLVTMWVDTD